MNKFVLSLVIVAVLAVALGTTGVAFAQGQVPSTPQNPGSGWGAGMMGGRGMRGGMMGTRAAGSQTGFLHEEMVAAFAEKLGLTVDELNARLANGETIAQIASSQGLTIDQFRTLMAEARAQALDQAVEDGTLTQAQADWMKQRGAEVMGGGHGVGQGRFANPSCPYYNQANP
jgi:hypothetical protein